ncbi:MAG TPA: hypothetical protein VFU02_15410 [Polyangiaceae bacterium]|nr:hypothetical protein [Polyangiaceae bacterium]
MSSSSAETSAGGANTSSVNAATSGGSSGAGGDATNTNTSSSNTNTNTNTATGGSGGSSGGDGGASSTGGSGGGANSTVRGTVVNHWLHPVPGVIVMVGDQEAMTDGDGAFEFEEVPETYDIMLDVTYPRYGGTGRYGWVYQGVTRRDPTLQVYGGLALRSSNVLVNPTNVTAGTDRVAVMALGGDYGRYDREGDTASYVSFSYFGPPAVTMYGHALQWIESEGLPTEYVAYDSTNLIAFDSEVTDYVAFTVDFTENEVASGAISGSVTSLTGDARRNAVYVRFASNALIQVVDDSPGAEGSFVYTVPSLPEASILVAAHEGTLYDGARAVAYQNGLSPGATDVALEIPSPPVLNAPAPGAVLDENTVFSWSGDAQAFVWQLSSDTVYEAIYVVTSSKDLTVPAFANGLDLVRPGDTYTWRVETHGDPDSVDAMLGAEGFMGDFHDIAYDEPDGPGAGSGSYATSAASSVTAAD